MTGPTLTEIVARFQPNPLSEGGVCYQGTLHGLFADLRALATTDPLREARERIEALRPATKGADESNDEAAERQHGFLQCRVAALAALAAPPVETAAKDGEP